MVLKRRLLMEKLLVGFVALPFLAGVAPAGQPLQLSDRKMDKGPRTP
jgi:hypothetical protein